MSYFYKSHFFAQTYWEGDEYWRPKVKAPVPVPVLPGGGTGGVWPLWRIKECEDWAKEHAKACHKKWTGKKWKKLPKLDPLEAIKKKKGISEAEKKNREIRGLRKKIETLKDSLKGARESIDDLQKKQIKKDSSRRERHALRREIYRLNRLVEALGKRIHKLEREKYEAEQQAIESFRKSLIPAPAPVVVVAPPVPVPPSPMQVTIAAFEEKKRKLLGALPWAIGAGGVFLGTRYLVPDDMEWLKFVGYLGSGALATVAVVKLLEARTVGPVGPLDMGLEVLPIGENR